MMAEGKSRAYTNEGSDDSCDIRSTSQVRTSTRGRSRMSRASLIVLREEIETGNASFCYPREVEYSELLATIKSEASKKVNHNQKPLYVVCLNKGLSEAEKLIDLAKLDWSVVSDAKLHQRRTEAGIRETIIAGMHDNIKAMFTSDRLPTMDEEKKNDLKLKVDHRWKAVYLRYEKTMKFCSIAAITKLSTSTVYRLCRDLKDSPEDFALKLANKAKDPIFIGRRRLQI